MALNSMLKAEHNSLLKAKYLIGLFVTITALSCNFSPKTESVADQQSTNNTQKKMNWFPLTDVTQLTEITEESFKHPVLIFKYSTTCSISATAKGRLERNWDTTQVGNLKIGDEVDLKMDAYPEKPIKGRILSIAESTGAKTSLLPPDNASGNFVKVTQKVPVKIEILDLEKYRNILRAGLSMEVSVPLK